jgi:hypothetical protein
MANLFSGAAWYKFIDPKVGLTSGANQQIGSLVWQPNTAYVVGQIVRNGGFYFRCSVAGTSLAALNAGIQASGPTPNTLVDNGATWVLVGPAGSGLYAADAAPQHEVGYEAEGLDVDRSFGAAWFRYVKFSGAVNPGDWVIVDQADGTAVQSPAAAPGASKFSVVAIAMGTMANGQYGWVLIKGTHDAANVTAGGTVGNLCAGVGTAGRSTTVQTANYLFDGSVLRNAGVVGTGVVELYWPSCSGR